MNFITAHDLNNVIGVNNELPWYLPEDLKRFKRLTLNKTVVMGRKTYESIGKPLPNRTNIVLTRTFKNMKNMDGCIVTDDISLIERMDDVFIIGGAEIYSLFAHLCRRVYVTVVKSRKNYSGDITYFPWESFDESVLWKTIEHNSYINYDTLALEREG